MKRQPSLNCSAPSPTPPEEGLEWEEHPTNPGLALTRRVLVAEDDPALRELMARLLAFVSALPGEMLQRQVRELNALFLPKPFALENLRRIANRVEYDHQNQTSDMS